MNKLIDKILILLNFVVRIRIDHVTMTLTKHLNSARQEKRLNDTVGAVQQLQNCNTSDSPYRLR